MPSNDNNNTSTDCIECKDHSSRIARNEIDIQNIFKMINGLLWKIAIITGLIMGIGQGATILIVLNNLQKAS